jgi:2-polyprenyl-3-methyl-5-hydroxy-6-metoxy-1,4-benzoquinol methylase
MNTFISCPVTGRDAKFYCLKNQNNYYINQEDGIIFLNPMPTIDNMMDYANSHYKSGVYRDYVDAKELKVLTANARLNNIDKYSPGKKLLDVGCSAGFFIETAFNRGYDVQGIEFSISAIEHAIPSIKNKIIHGDVHQELRRWQETIDCVTAFDIVEHLHDPIKFLKSIKDILRPGGLLVMSTPDTGHILRRLMGASWPMLQPLQHTVLFSRSAMKAILATHGFIDINIQPTYKYLTFSYLAKQLLTTNKIISMLMRWVLMVIPKTIANRPFRINIGEFIVFARKPN